MDLSLSNSISKETKFENTEMSTAYFEDLKNRKDDAISNERIQNGDIILDTYEVTSDAISGGMGSVWRVHHNSWNTDLAMKRPQQRFFAEGGDAKKAQFVDECEHWINLGLHPNIVSCYYVREIGGVPTIFSEWMDGGSLSDRIKDGSLYEGTEDEIQERILDIAIQAARGLQYSHENGLIHQDFKPGNLLLTKEWDAKVADFGLAKAKSNLDDGSDTAKTTGYTLAYCPQEQVDREEPQKWMDVYSWALTVLEMYAGKRLWQTGAEAKERFEEYSAQCAHTIPDEMQSLLNTCLMKKTDGFKNKENTFTEIYLIVTKEKYLRKRQNAANDTPESLNNRALSFLDLGKQELASALLKRADTQNACAAVRFNALVNRLRHGEIIPKTLERLCRELPDDGTIPNLDYLIAQVYLESGDPDKAEEVVPEEFRDKIAPVCAQIRDMLHKAVNYSAPWIGYNHMYIIKNGVPEPVPLLSREDVSDAAAFVLKKEIYDVNPDKTIALLKDGKKCFVVNLYSGQMHELVGNRNINNSKALFSPDGEMIAYPKYGTKVAVLSTNDMKTIVELDTGIVSYICFSTDGKYIYTARTAKSAINVYELYFGKHVRSYETNFVDTDFICFSPDGNLLVTNYMSTEGELRIAKTGQIIARYEGNITGGLSNVSFSEDGKQLIMVQKHDYYMGSAPVLVDIYDIPDISRCIFRTDSVLNKVNASKETLKQSADYDEYAESIMGFLDEGKIEEAYSEIESARKRLSKQADPLLLDLRWEAGQYMYRKRPVAVYKRKSFSILSPIITIHISPDSSKIVLFAPTLISEYSIPDGIKLSEIKVKTRRLFDPLFESRIKTCLSHDGKYVFASGTFDFYEEKESEIHKINLRTGKSEAVFDLVKTFGIETMKNGHSVINNRVVQLCVSDDDWYLYARLLKGSAIWDAHTGEPVCVFSGKAPVDGLWIGTHGKKWVINDALKTVQGHFEKTVPNVSFAAGTGECDSSRRFFHYRDKIYDGQYIDRGVVYGTKGDFQCFLPGSRYYLGVSEDSTHVYNIEGKQDYLLYDKPLKGIVSPDGRWLVDFHKTSVDVYELEWEQRLDLKLKTKLAAPFLKHFGFVNPDLRDEDKHQLLTLLRREGFGFINEDNVMKYYLKYKPKTKKGK